MINLTWIWLFAFLYILQSQCYGHSWLAYLYLDVCIFVPLCLCLLLCVWVWHIAVWVHLIVCNILLKVNVCAHVCESVSLSACGEPGGGTHLGGCSSTPRHAPSAPSGCGRTKPVHFHSHAPAGRILIIISPMMRRCDALHSRSLSQFLSFFLSLFLLFTFMVSEEKRKEENEGDLTWYCCLQKSVQFCCCKAKSKLFCGTFCGFL